MRAGLLRPSRAVISPKQLPARSRSNWVEYSHSLMPTRSPPGLTSTAGFGIST
jgi:hypothetical protein